MCVTGRQLCVGGSIKSNVFPSSFTICFSGESKLLSDNKALLSRTNEQTAQYGWKWAKQTKTCYQFDICCRAKQTVQAACLQKFEKAHFSHPLFSLHHGWRVQFTSHQRELIIYRRGLDPSLLWHNEALYFGTIGCFLGFLSLFLGSLASSLYPRIIPAQIWVHWEYRMNTFFKSNSKLQSFFFFFLSSSDNSG